MVAKLTSAVEYSAAEDLPIGVSAVIENTWMLKVV